MKRILSLAHLTAIDVPPPELIEIAGDVGFDAVGLRLLRVTDTSPGYPLMHDRQMMRATLAALCNTGLRVLDIEFVKIEPTMEFGSLEAFLDAGAELGASEVIAAPYDRDLSRLADNLSILAERAGQRGIGVSLEFFPWTCVPTLEAAIEIVAKAEQGVGILPDSLHFDRSNSRLTSLRDLPRNRLRFAHFCDATVGPPYSMEELLHAARVERLPPGEGEIDLVSFLNALPPDIPLALEVPMTAMARSEGPRAVVKTVMAATRRYLENVGKAKHISWPNS